MAEQSEIFLTPRVIDQRAFDELSAALRALINDADAVGHRLTETIQTYQQLADAPASAHGATSITALTAALQERLRLGARMLKAFQMQIERVEAAIAQGDASRSQADQRWVELDARLKDIDAQMTERAEIAAKAMDDAIDAAGSQIEERLGQRIAKLPQLEQVESRLEEMVTAAVSRFEERVAEREREAGNAAAQMAERAAELERMIAQLDRSGQLSRRVEQMLARLEPWRGLLLESEREPDGTPKPVAIMVEGLRDGIGRDMTQLSATMRELADRVELCRPTSKANSGPKRETNTAERGAITTTTAIEPRQAASGDSHRTRRGKS